jgi:hypothetical protein
VPTVGPVAPTQATTSSINGGTVAWQNLTGALTVDANGAFASGLGSGVVSQYLQAVGFGFTLPSDAVILGIAATITRKQSATQQVQDKDVRIWAGSVLGQTRAKVGTVWPSTGYQPITYGGAADAWGANLSYAQVNDSRFGIAISATNPATTNSTAAVDGVTITITYSTGGGTGGGTPGTITAQTHAASSVVLNASAGVSTSTTVTAVDATGLLQQTVLDNANMTTFVGALQPADGSLILAFIEAASSTRYALTYYRTADPTAATPAWSLYRREHFNDPDAVMPAASTLANENQRSAYYPQAHAVGTDGRWLRRINNEDLGATPMTGILQYLIGADKSNAGSASWTNATGTDLTFGSNPANKVVQVSRIIDRSDGRKMYFGEQWAGAAGTRPTSGAARIHTWRPYVAIDTNGNGTGITYCMTGTPEGANLFYPNEPGAVELANGDWLMIWRSGTLPWKDDATGTDTAATARSSQYIQVLLRKTSGQDTYTFQTPKPAPFSTATAPIHPELRRDPSTGAIVFTSRSPEGSWYTLDEGATWRKLNYKSPAATYYSGYYPQLRMLSDGRMVSLAHRGGDDAYGDTDNAILFDRWTLTPTVVTATTAVYVDPDNGVDTTTTGSVSQPFKTVRGALLKIASIIGANKRGTVYVRRSANNVANNRRYTTGAIDLTGLSFSQMITVSPYPGDSVIIGPVLANNCQNIRFENSQPAAQGAMRVRLWDTDLGTATQGAAYDHPFFVTGHSTNVELSGALFEDVDTYNAVWFGPDATSSGMMVENCVFQNHTYYGTAFPTTIVVATRAPNIWIRRNRLQDLLGHDGVQITASGTTQTSRHRNLWIEDNVMNGLYDGPGSTNHCDAVQVIGYSGAVGTWREDTSGERPTGDVGVVIRRNTIIRTRGFLFMPNAGGTDQPLAEGEHDRATVIDNLFHDPRGAGATTDTPVRDYWIRMAASCPNAWIVGNTCSLYPIGAQATPTTCIHLQYAASAPAPGDRPTINVTLANNITDNIGVTAGVTFAYNGFNTYRFSSGYTPGPGDIQGVPTFTNPAAGDFSLAPNNPTVLDNGNSTYASTTDVFGRRRGTPPDRGAVERSSSVSIIQGDLMQAHLLAYNATVSGGAAVTPVVATPMVINSIAWPETRVGQPTPPPTPTGEQGLILDPDQDPLTLLDSTPASTGFILTKHDFGSPQFSRLTASSVETEGDVRAAVHVENRTITLAFDVRADTHTNLQGLMRQIDAKVAKYARTGGELRWTLPSGTPITYDIIGVDSYAPAFSDQPDLFYEGKVVQVQLSLVAKPYGRAATLTDFLVDSVSTAEAMLESTLRVPGDAPALATMRVSVVGSNTTPHSVTWGLESENYDPSNTDARALYGATQMEIYSASGTVAADSTAYQNAAAQCFLANQGTEYDLVAPITTASGPSKLKLPHRGVYRVMMRAKTAASPSTTNPTGVAQVRYRLRWWGSFGGTRLGGNLNPWVYPSGASNTAQLGQWQLYDLGVVYADPAGLNQGWSMVVTGQAVDGNGTLARIDSLYLIPAELYGQASQHVDYLSSLEVGSDHVWATTRSSTDGQLYTAAPTRYVGDYLRVPAGRYVRLCVRVSGSEQPPGLLNVGKDAGTTAPFAAYTVSVDVTPRYLTIPEAD